MAAELVDVRLFHKNIELAKITTSIDHKNPEELDYLFRSMLKLDPKSDRREVLDYKMRLYRAGTRQKLQSYTGLSR